MVKQYGHPGGASLTASVLSVLTSTASRGVCVMSVLTNTYHRTVQTVQTACARGGSDVRTEGVRHTRRRRNTRVTTLGTTLRCSANRPVHAYTRSWTNT